MLLKFWRFLALTLAALSLGLSTCHMFEMPARLRFDQDLWVRLTVFEGIFRYFGSIGAVIEVGSVLAGAILPFLVRRYHSRGLYLSIASAVCLMIALLSWFIFVSTANAEFAKWLTGPVSPDFDGWRRQWEYGHAVNAVIKLIGFGLLTASVVSDTGGGEA